MRAAISYFYSSKVGSDIGVERKMLDALGNVTQELSNASKIEFIVTLKKMISGESVAGISVIPIDTESTISIMLPRDF